MNEGRRERKHAQTRLALLWALRDRMAVRPLEDIGVRELADAADVSEATFYNYFPTKADLALFFVQAWSIDVGWHAAQARAAGPRAAIAAIFEATAQQIVQAPRVMGEIIAVQSRLDVTPSLTPMSPLEKRLAFPDRPGIEDIDAVGLDGLLPPLLRAARKAGELPRTADLDAALLALVSVFFGVPLILARRAPTTIAAAYRQQLALTWRGLAAPARKARP